LQALNVEILEAENHLQLAVTLGIVLPVGPGQVVPLPAGIVRVPLSKEAAKTTGQGLLDGAENLPDPPATSDLVIANSLAGVDQAVQNVDRFGKRA
jgi:hypothetical protein